MRQAVRGRASGGVASARNSAGSLKCTSGTNYGLRMAQPRIVTTDTEPGQVLAVRVSAKQRRALERVAKREQVSVSQLLRDLIEEAVSA